ncbi:MAG: hypothetical protein ACE5HV_08885 [Acidobacteriota bacterium]
MSDAWTSAEAQPSDKLARLHHFSMIKQQGEQEIEFLITVREFVSGSDQSMRFVAQADKQTNQKTAPYTPIGWGHTLNGALAECVRAVHRFPYQGKE